MVHTHPPTPPHSSSVTPQVHGDACHGPRSHTGVSLTLEPTIYTGRTLGVLYSLGLDQCVRTRVHHYRAARAVLLP